MESISPGVRLVAQPVWRSDQHYVCSKDYWQLRQAGRTTTISYWALWCFTHSAASRAANDAIILNMSTHLLFSLQTCMMDNFDTEIFIIDIQNRPSIWDSSSADYSNRDLKKKCWEEIVDLYGGEGQTVEQKKDLDK
ncbi:unnamed protein product [Acanthoscelides obtectus]|uniref:MADF domain-containing protein n=1 Tax=Acanthoscelides obtectus TaxID=200917 RepID=A0A9P0L3N2_ACAOB|nr:unnamed protein product [Acanthoscelides obtectus]CAK1633023.1 hypothetical protein AOBTE_LOCUS7881 [Acanthoscelides obtectus]